MRPVRGIDLVVRSGGGEQHVSVDARLDAPGIEQAELAANRWIKSLRHLAVDGRTLRDRFTFRGDSLWWFAELYLHKRQVVARAHRTLLALERLADDVPGGAWRVVSADPVVRHLAPLVAARHRRVCRPATGRRGSSRWRGRTKAAFHTGTAVADRLRRVDATRLPREAEIAAFLHAAFFRGRGDDPYTGPVLRELHNRLEAGALQIVGLGPRTSFRVRGWRDRVREFTDPEGQRQPFTPVEAFAGWRALKESLGVWRARRENYDALRRSEALRSAAWIGGYDLWPVIEPELEGIASLQFPWSARAMDEAGAALDHLRPGVALTYAEAGGWGRAVLLEARRRRIPTAALQHGFIYRHWLNYLHDADEVQPSPGNPADRGFPFPTLTLLFDELAADHLRTHGAFPPEALRVTGSPRLDALVTGALQGPGGRDATRAALGVGQGGPYDRLALVATKYTQVAPVFSGLVRAAASLPGVLLMIKPHPAEDAAPYLGAAGAVPNVRVAGPDLDLSVLLAAADLLVTVNSTAAIEAMTFDLPALVVGLPNNLSPFVAAGAMAGAADTAAAARQLETLLYDDRMREQLAVARRAFAARYRIGADGQAARRAADAVLGLIGPSRNREP